MKLRDAFVADEGMTFIEIDLKQAEAMVVAWLANDEPVKEAFRRGNDIHSLNASFIFNKPYEWIVQNKKVDPQAKRMRQAAKVITHGWAYGAGWKTLFSLLLQEGVETTPAECKRMIDEIAKKRPAVVAWHREIKRILKTTKTLETPLGFRRTFHGRYSDTQLREALAFIPQSTVGHLTVKVWNKIYQKYPEVYPCMNVHDSLLIQVPENNWQKWLKTLTKEFEVPIVINGDELIIPVEAKVGKRWGSMEEVEVD